jgi:endonuclease YncB( thermonuclease family)
MILARVLLFCLLAAPALADSYRRGDVIEGPATRIRDGDTLLVADLPIRLNGVSAPERSEPGGAAAAEALRRIVQGQALRCALTGERTYDRWVATCWIGTLDVGAAIIATGAARDCPRYSGGRYAAVETAASRRHSLPGYCTPK